MPQLATRSFGTLEYTDDAVLHFPAGLPGFETALRFLAVERPRTAPAVFLQSLERPELCFVTLPVQAIDPGYEVNLDPEDLQVLGCGDTPVEPGDLLCLAIVCLHGAVPTANLLGPVIVHRKTRRGVQAVRDDRRYSAWHPLLPGRWAEPGNRQDVARPMVARSADGASQEALC